MQIKRKFSVVKLDAFSRTILLWLYSKMCSSEEQWSFLSSFLSILQIVWPEKSSEILHFFPGSFLLMNFSPLRVDYAFLTLYIAQLFNSLTLMEVVLSVTKSLLKSSLKQVYIKQFHFLWKLPTLSSFILAKIKIESSPMQSFLNFSTIFTTNTRKSLSKPKTMMDLASFHLKTFLTSWSRLRVIFWLTLSKPTWSRLVLGIRCLIHFSLPSFRCFPISNWSRRFTWTQPMDLVP